MRTVDCEPLHPGASPCICAHGATWWNFHCLIFQIGSSNTIPFTITLPFHTHTHIHYVLTNPAWCRRRGDLALVLLGDEDDDDNDEDDEQDASHNASHDDWRPVLAVFLLCNGHKARKHHIRKMC